MYIVVFMVIYCCPYSVPVKPESMNYSSLIVGAVSIAVAVWWAIRGGSGRYVGPRAVVHGEEDVEFRTADSIS